MTGNERQSHDSEREQNKNTSKAAKQKRIQELNDKFRKTGQGGQHVITSGIQELGPVAVLKLRYRIIAYKDFSDRNDPHGEHDFGSLIFEGNQVFWKIDYYDLTLTSRSPDPADPEVTTRVLTIMLASEY